MSPQKRESTARSLESNSNNFRRLTRVSEIIVIDDDEEDVSDASRELSAVGSVSISDKRLAEEIESDRQPVITEQEITSVALDGRQRHEVTDHASVYSGLPLARHSPKQYITNINTNTKLPLLVGLDSKRGEDEKPAVLSYASTSQNKKIARGVRSIETQHGTSKCLLDVAVLQPFPDLQADPIIFDPSPDMVPCPWWVGENDAPYALLVHALQALTSTRSRIAILSILTNVLRILITHDPDSVLPALYLLSNSLSPPWQGVELGIGGSIISKVR